MNTTLKDKIILRTEQTKAENDALCIVKTIKGTKDPYDDIFEEDPAPVRRICRLCIVNLNQSTNHTECLLKGLKQGCYSSPSDWFKDCEVFATMFAPDDE